MNTTQLSLDGRWLLSGSGARPVPSIPAEVPGNIERDLERAGLIPDPFFGTNAEAVRPYEFNNWEYSREFELPADFPAAADLVFEAIDCVSEISINGHKVGETKNAFIRHRFAVDEFLLRGQTNRITVRIQSPLLVAAAIPLDHHCFAQPWNFESLMLRKPAHSFGWDIAPRLPLGGIWRSVRLEERPANRMRSCYIDVCKNTTAERATLSMSYDFVTELTEWKMFDVEISGRCGDSCFVHREQREFTAGCIRFEVDHPRLWYPANYGEQAIYEVDITISYQGKTLLVHHTTVGIRTVRLVYDETPGNFVFRFEINSVPIMVKGSNWVPADALHSRDAERTIPILELFRELGCNMLRVWGGGVYESAEFYDYCDRHGIMVWQDFMMACGAYPQTGEFLENFRTECEWAVAELRRHPALVLWAGDNEVDQFVAALGDGRKPSANRLTREVIPQVLNRLDPGRPYLPSSPYISPGAEALGHTDLECPEQHVWGPRDYFKSPFYADNPAAFISETGYHGSPSVESIRKFISPEKLWPGLGNPEWDAHSTTYNYRIKLMYDQIIEFFGFEPENLEDFVCASQIVQAEAKKFFIENVRGKKWRKSGVLWWNVMDCWPQFSDAVVDYYFDRKLAFSYIKRSQQPLLGMIGEWRNWGHEVIVTSDLLESVSGTIEVADAETGERFFEGAFNVPANNRCVAGFFRLPNHDRRLLLIRWRRNDGGPDAEGFNHFVTGRPAYDFARYRDRWLKFLR